MAKEYPVIAVIGTEECKKEMEQIQDKAETHCCSDWYVWQRRS